VNAVSASRFLALVLGTVVLKCYPGLLCRDSQLLTNPIGAFILWTIQALRREYSVSEAVNALAVFTRQPMPLRTSHTPWCNGDFSNQLQPSASAASEQVHVHIGV